MRRAPSSLLPYGWYLLLALCAIIALSLARVSLASADRAPSLVVTDEGPGVVNTVGVTANVGGTCAEVYEAQQANGSAICSANSWPGAGSQWLPTLTLSEGDTLRLAFSASVSNVTFASVTNYPPGLTTPSGTPAPNSNVIPPSMATITTNPDAWTAHIPNPLSGLASSPVTFAVVARDATEDHDYFFSIQKPHCVGPNETSPPGTFPCGLPPGGRRHVGNATPQNPTQQPSSGTPGHTNSESPKIKIVNVEHLGDHRYRVAVFASGPGKLSLVWFQHARRIAQLSRRLTKQHTTFTVQVRANEHARLKIDATFHAQGGGIARTAFAGL